MTSKEDTIHFLLDIKKQCINYISNADEKDKDERDLLVQFHNLLDAIKTRLHLICDHCIETDEIEVGERIQRIQYCTICEGNLN